MPVNPNAGMPADATPVAVYTTPIPGSTVVVDTCYPEGRATGGVLTFMPVTNDTSKMRAHPHMVGQTIHTEGYLFISSPKLIELMDNLVAGGNVPFQRSATPMVSEDLAVGVDDGCLEPATNAG